MSTPRSSEPAPGGDRDQRDDATADHEQSEDAADDDAADDLLEREERAVDASTAEQLSPGVLRNQHGEYEPDPFPEGEDPGDSAEDVIELHRQQAERLEHQPDVPRADE